MLKPKIKAYLDIFPTGDDRHQVRGTDYVSVLKGNTMKQVFGRLLPLLDGEYTTEEILENLQGVASPEVIKALLLKLEGSGVLENVSIESNQGLSLEQVQKYQQQMDFFAVASRQANKATYQKALLESTLSIIGGGELAAKVAIECTQAGIGKVIAVNLADDLPAILNKSDEVFDTLAVDLNDITMMENCLSTTPPSLLVLALDRTEPAILERLGQLSQDRKIPLLYAQMNGTEGIIGPLVAPGKTACLKCYHLRLTRNYNFYDEYLQWEKWIEGDGKYQRSIGVSVSAFTSVVAGMTALEIIKKLSSFYEPELYGKFLTVNALTLEVIPHKILRVPRCPSCGKLRNKVAFTPWSKDERHTSKGRISYRPSSDPGKNGDNC
jgi:bacteriocin biosynthesis cyclodehydratase domain-containing protein